MVTWSVQPTWRMHAFFVELCINFHSSMSSTHSLSSSGSSRNLSGPFQNIICVAPTVRPRQHLEFSTLNFDIADIHRIPIPLPPPPSRIEFLHNPLVPTLPSLSTSYAQTEFLCMQIPPPIRKFSPSILDETRLADEMRHYPPVVLASVCL